MSQLSNKTTGQLLVPELRVADSMIKRVVGLLGTQSLDFNEGLWIKSCNSIHTYFMKYPIDCVFLDKTLKVVSIKSNVNPWKIVAPQWGATSVIELKAGSIEKLKISEGEQLHVGN